MQLPYHTALSGSQYVIQKEWLNASLDCCPNHRKESCSFQRHGHYKRKTAHGYAWIVRYYCKDSHMTFSLLPDCFAARMPGTLDELEQTALLFEAGGSAQQVTDAVRENCQVEPGGKRRWSLRRLSVLLGCLTVLLPVLDFSFVRKPIQLSVLRDHLSTDRVLVELRRRCLNNLQKLPPPIGFRPP